MRYKVIFMFAFLGISCTRNDAHHFDVVNTDSSVLLTNQRMQIEILKDRTFRCDDTFFCLDDSSGHIYFNNGCSEVLYASVDDFLIKNRLRFSRDEFVGGELKIFSNAGYVFIIKDRIFLLCKNDLSEYFNLTDSLYSKDKHLFLKKAGGYKSLINGDSIEVTFDVRDPNSESGLRSVAYRLKIEFVPNDPSKPISFLQNHEPVIYPVRIR